MPRFFCDVIEGPHWEITGEDAGHIAGSLRMRVGDSLTLCDKKGMDYCGILETVSREIVTGRILEQYPSQTEPNLKITLYMAMPKADKAEWVVQKSVELGVTEIVFMLTHRCVSRPDDKGFEKKRERFQRIALEAAKQSGRGIVPQVLPLMGYAQVLKEIQGEKTLLFYEEATQPLKACLQNKQEQLSILIGAEGGFEPKEVQQAQEQGAEIVSLGKRILRCETAPLAALSAILYEYGNF